MILYPVMPTWIKRDLYPGERFCVIKIQISRVAGLDQVSYTDQGQHECKKENKKRIERK